jgi:hypothetical protein
VVESFVHTLGIVFAIMRPETDEVAPTQLRSTAMGNMTHKMKKDIKDAARAMKQAVDKGKDAVMRAVDKGKAAAVRGAEKVKDTTDRAAEKVKRA